jgi:hypothetical protein
MYYSTNWRSLPVSPDSSPGCIRRAEAVLTNSIMMEQSGQANSEGEVRARILTDLTGRFDTIVFEMEAESLAEFERRRSDMFADPQYQQDAPKMAELIDRGSSEFYAIEE